jgi:hypothetical protein
MRSTAEPNSTPAARTAAYSDVDGSNVSVNESALGQVGALQPDALTVCEQYPFDVHHAVPRRNLKSLRHFRGCRNVLPGDGEPTRHPSALRGAIGV